VAVPRKGKRRRDIDKLADVYGLRFYMLAKEAVPMDFCEVCEKPATRYAENRSRAFGGNVCDSDGCAVFLLLRPDDHQA
jgi:hypothetical protein